MTDLLVMVPTRGRRANCERLLKSFRETASPGTDLVFITDPDDDSYEGMDWGPADCGTLSPRGTLREKLNQTATAFADAYPALMWCGDDHVFHPPKEGQEPWDRLMLAALKGLGTCDRCRPGGQQDCVGHGWVYPDTVRRRDVPEIWLASSSLVKALGWFFPPHVNQFYGDNSIAELGKRAGLIRICPEAVIEHLHYSITPDVEHDEVYREAEDTFGASDLQAFQQWRALQLANDVAVLRRKFSPDVAWVLSRVA